MTDAPEQCLTGSRSSGTRLEGTIIHEVSIPVALKALSLSSGIGLGASSARVLPGPLIPSQRTRVSIVHWSSRSSSLRRHWELVRWSPSFTLPGQDVIVCKHRCLPQSLWLPLAEPHPQFIGDTLEKLLDGDQLLEGDLSRLGPFAKVVLQSIRPLPMGLFCLLAILTKPEAVSFFTDIGAKQDRRLDRLV